MTPEHIKAIMDGCIENEISNFYFNAHLNTEKAWFKQSLTTTFVGTITPERIQHDLGVNAEIQSFEAIFVNNYNGSYSPRINVCFTKNEPISLNKARQTGKTKARRQIAKLIFNNENVSYNIKCDVMQLFMQGKLSWEDCVTAHKTKCEV